ncbi:hypothetical protein ABB55_03380 [Prosthecomicrobium hirschii]|uniref:Pilus assembly protein n=1 Tax=Prosthecodimorpha hirschii TaxID=665126 RepID=A0A0P6VZY6_9HYPH|nr:DUF1028 domain-containing protein [Prosthecomicrobium hirschii]KPL51388.1 hypothetical protein ABB55_03380 [Prosthecomicrobium hirschii]
MELNTFSIVARCAAAGHLGVAVATAVPAVGSMCPFTMAATGAVSTQSWVNPYLALAVLDRLAGGEDAEAALAAVLAEDEAADLRQIGVVDGAGRASAWTGAACTPWAGHIVGEDFAVQGNMLTGPEVIDAMAAAFRASAGEALDERLMRALEAGDAAGGDRRGKQSAALRVHGPEAYPLLDIRADEHPHPVGELRRILGIARLQLMPFVAHMPKRGQPAGPQPAAVTDVLALAPPDRPGGGGAYPAR